MTREAVSYARVSSKEQEGFSIPSQDRLVTGYAANNRLTTVQRFEDVETAKRPGRPNFDKMVAFLKRNPRVRVLLVEKTDRLYRNLKDYVTMDEFDIEIHFIKENFVLSKDSRSSEKFMHGIKVLMAKNYIDNLSEVTRKRLLEKVKKMIYPLYAPLGYHNVVGPNGKKIIEPDPDRAALMILTFEWYGAGNYSINQITEKAAQVGLVSKAARTRKRSLFTV